MRQELPFSSCHGPVGPICRRATLFVFLPAGAGGGVGGVATVVAPVAVATVAVGDGGAVADGAVVVDAGVIVVEGLCLLRPIPLLGFEAIQYSFSGYVRWHLAPLF